MTPADHGEAVTSNRDTLAAWFEKNLTHEHYQDWTDAEFADALMPTVEAMLAQARAEVVAAVEATAWVTQDICNCDSERGRFGAHRGACPVMALRAALAAVSGGTDHDTTLDTVRAEALRDVDDANRQVAVRMIRETADSIGSNDLVVADWLNAYADRIAPDDTPSERGGDDAA